MFFLDSLCLFYIREQRVNSCQLQDLQQFDGNPG